MKRRGSGAETHDAVLGRSESELVWPADVKRRPVKNCGDYQDVDVFERGTVKSRCANSKDCGMVASVPSGLLRSMSAGCDVWEG